MKGIILAGGLGKRFRPLSHAGPKQLVPIANKPVLHYVVEDLVNAGIRDIGVVVSHIMENAAAVENSLKDGSRWDCRITYIHQDAPRGLAHAVGICHDFVGGDEFVVYLGDNILKGGIVRLVEEFHKTRADAAILVTPVDDPTKYGVAVLDEAGDLIDVEEKPQQPRSNLVIIGVYMFTPALFGAIDLVTPGAKGELQLTDAIKIMVHSGKYRTIARQIEGWWDDTGTFEAVLNANNIILHDLKGENLGEIAEGARIVGHVRIGRGTKILPGSLVKGPSIIGENCVIGPDTYIGGYTSIGDNVVIEGGEIEGSIIYNNVRIKHNGRITDSIIGEFSEITIEKQHPRGDRLILGSYSRVSRSI